MGGNSANLLPSDLDDVTAYDVAAVHIPGILIPDLNISLLATAIPGTYVGEPVVSVVLPGIG